VVTVPPIPYPIPYPHAPQPGTRVVTRSGSTARVGLYQTEYFKGCFPVTMLDGPEKGISLTLILTDLRCDAR